MKKNFGETKLIKLIILSACSMWRKTIVSKEHVNDEETGADAMHEEYLG
ncbi:20363_t:CDS:2 [Funneliformis geosporum]|nr:20363_t:CDS:2 [Funneliformis geosporum]